MEKKIRAPLEEDNANLRMPHVPPLFDLTKRDHETESGSDPQPTLQGANTPKTTLTMNFKTNQCKHNKTRATVRFGDDRPNTPAEGKQIYIHIQTSRPHSRRCLVKCANNNTTLTITHTTWTRHTIQLEKSHNIIQLASFPFPSQKPRKKKKQGEGTPAAEAKRVAARRKSGT